MKRFRRGLLVLSIFSFAISVVLLLNTTAPNPTHRRYSSRVVLATGQGSSQDIGKDAEEVLANDVNIPRNETSATRQYFCRTNDTAPAGGKCITYYVGLTASFRRPDFISDTLIIESKNRVDLSEDDRDLLNQIGDYSLVAITLNRPLWIYTRVNTSVDPKYYQLAEATGGGIVAYFAIDGYSDPVDTASRAGLGTSGSVIGVMALWTLNNRRHRIRRSIPVQEAPTSPVAQPSSTPSKSAHALKKAIDAVDRAHGATQQARDKLDS